MAIRKKTKDILTTPQPNVFAPNRSTAPAPTAAPAPEAKAPAPTNVEVNPDGTFDVTPSGGARTRLSADEFRNVTRGLGAGHTTAFTATQNVKNVVAAEKQKLQRLEEDKAVREEILKGRRRKELEREIDAEEFIKRKEELTLAQSQNQGLQPITDDQLPEQAATGKIIASNAPSIAAAGLSTAGVFAAGGAFIGGPIGAAVGGIAGFTAGAGAAIFAKIRGDRMQEAKESKNVFDESRKYQTIKLRNYANKGLYKGNEGEALAQFDKAANKIRISQQALKRQTQQDKDKFIDANAGDELFDVNIYLDDSEGISPMQQERLLLIQALMNPDLSLVSEEREGEEADEA